MVTPAVALVTKIPEGNALVLPYTEEISVIVFPVTETLEFKISLDT